jgi:putative lipoprotein
MRRPLRRTWTWTRRPPRPGPPATKRWCAPLVALVATWLAGPGLARAADADPWFGPDKALHFEAAGSLAIVGYAGTSMMSTSRPLRAALGAALGVGAGAAKELWDLDGHGDPSWRDLTWDLVGAATGVVVAAAFDWAIHRVFNWPVGCRSR